MQIDEELVQRAMTNASTGHLWKREVQQMLSDMEAYARDVLSSIQDGSYVDRISYRHFDRMNTNGKLRHISMPSLYTRVLQHLFIILAQPLYSSKDPGISYNCKKGYGITASDRGKSLLRRMKKLMYERRDLRYALVIDQRQCYDHMTRKLVRKSLKRLTSDSSLVDFGVNVSFDGDTFPIGTPTSPLVHHIVMLGFDRWLGGVAPYKVRYADDCLLAFRTLEEANQAKWRVKNYWWYEMRIYAKRHTCRIVHLETNPLSFCGMVVYRIHDEHSKGYCRIRRNILKRAKQCTMFESWQSYHGMLVHTDSHETIQQIEYRMKLSELTDRVKIKRPNDAKNIDIRSAVDLKSFNIYRYDIRRDKNGVANWIKMIIGVPDGSGRMLRYELHGNLQYLIDYLLLLEQQYPGGFLPIEDCRIKCECGYIFEGSNEVDLYI